MQVVPAAGAVADVKVDILALVEVRGVFRVADRDREEREAGGRGAADQSQETHVILPLPAFRIARRPTGSASFCLRSARPARMCRGDARSHRFGVGQRGPHPFSTELSASPAAWVAPALTANPRPPLDRSAEAPQVASAAPAADERACIMRATHPIPPKGHGPPLGL